jgi:hypothetical protein
LTRDTHAAGHSICPLHNGLVRETGDKEGAVFFCPIGFSYWRYTSNPANAGMYAPLAYPNEGVI